MVQTRERRSSVKHRDSLAGRFSFPTTVMAPSPSSPTARKALVRNEVFKDSNDSTPQSSKDVILSSAPNPPAIDEADRVLNDPSCNTEATIEAINRESLRLARQGRRSLNRKSLDSSITTLQKSLSELFTLINQIDEEPSSRSDASDQLGPPISAKLPSLSNSSAADDDETTSQDPEHQQHQQTAALDPPIVPGESSASNGDKSRSTNDSSATIDV